jgi:large-conductance mechanosensitive channel
MHPLEGFREFMIKYNVVGIMVGFAFAVTTIAFIKSFVSDIFIPSIYILLGQLIIKHISSTFYGKFTDLFGSPINIDNFIKEFITWVLIIISIYFIAKYFIQRTILGQDEPMASHGLYASPPVAPAPVTPTLSPYVQKKPVIQEENKYYKERFYM